MKPFFDTSSLPKDAVALRQTLFLASGGGISIAGILLMVTTLAPGGFSVTEWLLLALFVPLFGQISFGFAIAFWGFVVLALGGDRWQVMRTLPPEGTLPSSLPGSTAVVLPVFNEDPSRTFAGLENMFRSLEKSPHAKAFDFFILSDSNEPDRWLEEELAWTGLCQRLNAFGRIFYRKRRVSLHGKSGNIADFCRRWGNRYRYLLILDADSVMEGSTIVRLAQAMDANPAAGIIQTGPQIVRGTSLLQRLIQFTTRAAGPVFAAGSNFWHLGAGNYWGHNAIIRLQPFMEHCVLPEIPGETAAERHIMSHDTIEASLMKKAGYQVWFAYLEPGSYEEGPPNLLDSLKRDRRWCQGNLQHFWFLFAPSTHFANRLHIFFGLMAYLTAPMLALFIVLSAWDFFQKEQFARLSDHLATFSNVNQATLSLLGLTLGLLFLPKIFGTLLLVLRTRGSAKKVKAIVSSLLETVFSILLAPILLYFYTKFVVLTLLGLRVAWKTQNRADAGLTAGDAIRHFSGPTLAGIAGAAAAAHWTPALLPWLSPVLLGLVLAIPLAMLTGSGSAGRWLRERGLLLIPEEESTPEILKNLDVCSTPPAGGLVEVTVSPFANAVHTALLKRSKVRARHKEAFLHNLIERFLADGPHALSRRELMALLWDPEAVTAIHRRLWTTPGEALHADWRSALKAQTGFC